MTARSTRLGWVVPVVAAVSMLVGCADDGNDTGRAIPASPVPTSTTVEESDESSAMPMVPDPTVPEVSDTPSVEPTGVVVQVIALDNSFRPDVVEIAVGDAVEWENRGLNEHNVLRVDGDGWGVEVTDFQPGDVYSHVFVEPGEYRYYCSIHGSTEVGMVGTVLVRE